MSPRYIVELLNLLFTRFDRLAEKHGVEKIKTIGDCYMAVGGLFGKQPSDGSEVIELALDMVDVCDEMAKSTDYPIKLRIGIATGQVISGVIGEKRTAFDIWGQTVNLASRMESTGRVGQIQVSESTYWRLKDKYLFEKREGLVLKEGEKVTAFFLVGRA
jgi:class 3 adenylate cyclase